MTHVLSSQVPVVSGVREVETILLCGPGMAISQRRGRGSQKESGWLCLREPCSPGASCRCSWALCSEGQHPEPVLTVASSCISRPLAGLPMVRMTPRTPVSSLLPDLF